jgi:23S rRNA (cytidine1920-2'-O)/16S rRNA (cytidine1409-2'-O)-methyltransferase
MAKKRLDELLTEKGFFETKSKAQAAILAGKVKINDEKITKAGYQIKEDEKLDIQVEKNPYVSRGGFKIEKAIKEFNIDMTGKICLDAGASTGGFVDCMLQNGASKVYAVDVGYGQLDWKVRSDERVVVIERTNIKNCSQEEIYGENPIECDFLSADLSFISLEKVLDNFKKLLCKQEMVLLIKPQFEAGREKIQKGGVVRDKSVHLEVIQNVINYASKLDLFPQNLTYSPITGPSGNIEYLIYLKDEKKTLEDDKIQSIIDDAFSNLG